MLAQATGRRDAQQTYAPARTARHFPSPVDRPLHRLAVVAHFADVVCAGEGELDVAAFMQAFADGCPKDEGKSRQAMKAFKKRRELAQHSLFFRGVMTVGGKA